MDEILDAASVAFFSGVVSDDVGDAPTFEHFVNDGSPRTKWTTRRAA